MTGKLYTRRKKVGDILFSALDAFMVAQTDDPTGQDAQTDTILVSIPAMES